MDSKEKAIQIARLADENKAGQIRILDVSRFCNFTDIFVIATCGSSLQLRSLGRRIEKELREEGERPISCAGYDTTSWVVLDYADVVVHLFSAEAREYYRIDRLWRDGVEVDWAAVV